MQDTLIQKAAKEPMTYINGGGMLVSVVEVENFFKIAFYAVSIVTSLFLIFKYYLEIKKLREAGPTEEPSNHTPSDDNP
jgi:hypothetical protein